MRAKYTHKQGKIYEEDCNTFLDGLPLNCATTVFADPPYNIKKAEWDNLGNQQQYIDWCLAWIERASRVLNDNGTLYICGFTEILADVKSPAMQFFDSCRWLIWHYDNKANMRDDWGRSHESILCLRKENYIFNTDSVRTPYNSHTLKYPDRNQGGENSQYHVKNAGKRWAPHPLGRKPKDVIDLPTTCNGMHEKTKHPTQKPEALLRKLILASTNEGDIVVDPFSGSGTTAVVAAQLNRRFIVNDLQPEYNELAKQRLKNLVHHTIEEWIDIDNQAEIRRRALK